MIYLIWWTPRCGKTTIAKQLAQKLWITYIQSDYIASAIQSKRTESEEQQLFGDKRWNDDNRINNDIRFSVFTNQEQIQHYHINAQRNRSWIKNIINYAIADQENIIIEWYHLRPNIISEDLKKRWDQVSYILLYKSNIIEIEQWIKLNNNPNDRAIKKTFQNETYNKIASFIYDFGQLLKQDALSHNLITHDMSIGNFHENIASIVNQLTNS